MIQSAAASHIGDDGVTRAWTAPTANLGADANWPPSPRSWSKLHQLNTATGGTTMTATDNSAATTTAMPQWSEQGCCYFCPAADRSPCLLVSTVGSLSERIARLTGIPAPFAERAEAICRSCLRNLDELEQANLLRDLMRGHFESQHGNDIERELGFAYVLRPGASAECSAAVGGTGETMAAAGTSLLYGGGKGEASSSRRKCGGRPPMNLGQSRALIAGSKGLSISGLPAATMAEDQRSQMSSCDDGSSTSNGGNGGGGASGGPTDAASRCQRKIDRKRYSCRECNKVFGAKSHYDDHVTKHSNTKHFSCPLCGKAFKFKRGLREHVRDTHPERGLESLLMLSGMIDPGLTADIAGEPSSATRVKTEAVTDPTAVDGCDDGSGASRPPVLQDSSAAALPDLMTATNASAVDPPGPANVGNPSALLAVVGNTGSVSNERDLRSDDVPPPLDDECHDDVDFKDRDDCGDDDDDEDGDEDLDEDGDSEIEDGTAALPRGSGIADDLRSTAGKARSRRPGSLHLQLPARKRLGLQQQRQQSASPDVLVANSPLGVGSQGSGEAFGAGSFPCALCSSRFKYKRGLVSHLKRKHLENEASTAGERKTAVQMLDRLSNPRLVASAKKRVGQMGTNGSGKQRGPVAGGRDTRPIGTVAAGFVRGTEEASDVEDDDDVAPLQANSRESSLAGGPERHDAKDGSIVGAQSAQAPDWLAELKQSADKRRQGSSCSAGRSGSSLPQASSPMSANSSSNCSEGVSHQSTTTAAVAVVGRAGKATKEPERRHEQSHGPDDSTSSEAVKRTTGSADRSSGSSKRLRLGEAVSTVRA